MDRQQDILQIIPAHDTMALFGRREISDSSGSIKKQITEKIPVICWALVDDGESFIMGMVAQESGEIILVNQREDFLEYEIADGARKGKSIDYYEELIQGKRKPKDATESVISRTHTNAGMTLAFIGLKHPAFETVFKYFVAQNYPDLKQRLLLPSKHLCVGNCNESLDKTLPDMQKS